MVCESDITPPENNGADPNDVSIVRIDIENATAVRTIVAGWKIGVDGIEAGVIESSKVKRAKDTKQ